MADASAWISVIETSWTYWIPAVAVGALALAWLLGSRSASPPRLQPRIYRDAPTEAYSQLYGELREKGIARILYADVDQYLIAHYRVPLSRLPRTRRGARAMGATCGPEEVAHFRQLKKDLHRFANLSRPAIGPARSVRATRRRALRSQQAIDLANHLVDEVRRLDRADAPVSGGA